MRIRLTTFDGQQKDCRSDSGFKAVGDIPCLRCGVCCTRWQAPVDSAEAKSIAGAMDVPYDTFRQKYLQEYPFRDDYYLIRRENDACVFLKFENGLAGCAIHEHKPEACRNWNTSLERKECRQGLRKKGASGRPVSPSEPLLSQDELARLCRALTGRG